MKRSDITALHQQTVAELHKQLVELKGKQAKAVLAKAARKQVKGGTPSVIGDDIARIKTVLKQKEVETKVAQQAEK